MLEPTWNPTGLPVRRVAVAPIRRRAQAPALNWLLYAAPYTAAALWTAVTLMAMLDSAATGRRELLDWCRSDAALTGAGALTALAALVASVLKGTPCR